MWMDKISYLFQHPFNFVLTEMTEHPLGLTSSLRTAIAENRAVITTPSINV